MTTYSLAADLLGPGQTALCVMTNGQFLTVNEDRTGTSGYWVLDEQQQSASVLLIYKWAMRNRGKHVDVLLGSVTEMRKEEEGRFAGRYLISFSDMECVGSTVSDWEEFVPGVMYPTALVCGARLN